MREVLYAINRTVGFFGDATMGQEEVDKLVAEVRRRGVVCPPPPW